MGWRRGQIVVRREIWRGTPWLAAPVVVVEDAPDLLATYLPEDARFAFPPSADGRPHPWSGRGSWEGHGVLMLQRPGEAYAVWHFWDGPDRRFSGWYVNLQEPFRRTSMGFETMDLVLDVVISVDGSWHWKDEDELETFVARGVLDDALASRLRTEGLDVVRRARQHESPFDEPWPSWRPDPAWDRPELPRGWERSCR